jgi:hypothetical protein
MQEDVAVHLENIQRNKAYWKGLSEGVKPVSVAGSREMSGLSEKGLGRVASREGVMREAARSRGSSGGSGREREGLR